MSKGSFDARLEEFVREALGLSDEVSILRCRVSGGSRGCPSIDLKVAMCPRGEAPAFSVPLAGRRFLALVAKWLGEKDQGVFVGNSTAIFEELRGCLGNENLWVVPSVAFVGKALAQVELVGDARFSATLKKSNGAKAWLLCTKGEVE